MTPEELAMDLAVLNNMHLTTLIEMNGMIAENEQRKVIGQSMAYTFDDFAVLSDKYVQAWAKVYEGRMQKHFMPGGTTTVAPHSHDRRTTL